MGVINCLHADNTVVLGVAIISTWITQERPILWRYRLMTLPGFAAKCNRNQVA